MLRNVFTKSLRDGRRSLIGWALAIAAVAMMYAGFYPSMQTPAMTAALEQYPESLREIFQLGDTTAAGYLGSTVFGLLGPILLAIFAIALGTRAIAGEEEAGTLDLLLAHPVSRLRVAGSRYAALVVSLVVVGAVCFVGLLAVYRPARLDSIPVVNLAAMIVQLVLLGAFFGALALAVGGLGARRGTVFAVGGGVAVLAYVANAVAPQVDGLAWAQKLSPFHWYLGGEPLRNGLQAGGSLLLLATTAVLLAVGLWSFHHRDLSLH